ncbi:MAG: plasmid mobilization relaxosome protein MobC [Oscillospiraceae bacterium]|nr:plasmid mobilization relaxosome protein MobC [Oscillospiraceae bacterium]
MRKFKQVKRKEIIFDLKEWELVEKRAKQIQINTSDFIRRMAIKGQITIFDLKNVGELMKGLRIIGGNINQIARMANETHSVNANDVESLKLEVETLCRLLSQSLSEQQSNAA